MRLMLAVTLALTLSAPIEAKKRPATPPPVPSVEGQTAQPPVAPNGLPYLLFLPKGYNASKTERWPLVVFLHGSGERGSNLELLKQHGPPMLVEKDPSFPFIVISPQLQAEGPAAGEYWALPPLDALLDHALKTWRIDPSRVYLTGLSLGGIATWDWGTARPERFAALAPVAAFGDPRRACAAKEVPVWAFHGDRDDAVDMRGNFEMVDALIKCGGRPRLTIYPDTDHWSWVPAYNDPALWQWLLHQRKAPPKP